MPSFAHQEINQDSGSKRTPPVPPIPLEIKQISERLVKIKNENSAEDASANEIIRRMKALRADLQDTLGSCHKTMETSSHCLEDYFRHIAPAQLFQHVSARFSHFDKDHDGSLDRDEVREAMAEMGQRPTEQELDEFFALFDKDMNGRINLGEFDKMVRCKLGIIKPSSLKGIPEEEGAALGDRKIKTGW
eukprot:CAMPEP_0181295252 /NCGR_PEP_ID=MMETSP1101-20121128/4044_1 /TAXON_ID=46948 /ORGANISM="Rhodomonas abbreviata, Strain Caron Lab Isolate" /LENGTH=189 /DNA_ID=CAMNT_0023399983 /DNA_START=178 /DNA_END=744 /DNA_ORIENTATION=-